jgi:hypothetical protein
MKMSARRLMPKGKGHQTAHGKGDDTNMSSPALGFTDSNPDKGAKSPRMKNIMSKMVKK